MVDIAKCNRRDCPKHKTCFRYLADDEEYGQLYLVIDKKILDDDCEYYWQCRNPKELAYMNKVNR